MPPTRRKAPFWSPRASDTHNTNAWVPPKCAERISGAETIRTSSGANTSESRDGFRSCITHAPKKIPIKKTATAEKWLSALGKSPAAVATAPSTRLPVACPVKALARTKPAASPYPPTKLSAKYSHESIERPLVCPGPRNPNASTKNKGNNAPTRPPIFMTFTFFFRLKLHFRAKPQNHRVMASSADVRVILDNRLEEKHRQRV